jgi:hypothetical protein
MNSTLKKLKVLSARINQIAPRVNYGGCCVVASKVAPLVNELYPSKVRVLSNWGKASIDEVRNKIDPSKVRNWNNNGVVFSHVVVEMNVDNVDYFYDTEEISKHVPPAWCREHNMKMLPGWVSFEEAAVLAADASGWNDRFDRSLIAPIYDVVDEFFANFQTKTYDELVLSVLPNTSI